jgi:iron(III) transport system ATP-binding protein
LRGVRLSYGGTPVLRGVDLDVAAGELAVVTGPSGAGKTSLLHVIDGEQHPDAGTVRLDGVLLAGGRTSVRSDRRPVAYVAPQGGGLLAQRTVSANLALALPRSERNRRSGAAQVSEVFDLLRMPDELAGRIPGQLSLADRQRVAVARALLSRPRLLLLDEPFVALDAGTRRGLRAGLGALLRERGLTTVLVTHDDEVAELAGTVWRLAAGALTRPAG